MPVDVLRGLTGATRVSTEGAFEVIHESTLKTPCPEMNMFETAISRRPAEYSSAEWALWMAIKWQL